jgi:hypothetical protein
LLFKLGQGQDHQWKNRFFTPMDIKHPFIDRCLLYLVET